MASLTKHSILFLLLLTLLSSFQIHARDSQFFNKIPSNNGAKETELVVPNNEQQEPNFIPENENGGYGLYGHESNQLPPSTTTTTNTNGEPYKTTTNLPYNSQSKESFPNSKHLPKNYNTVAYVTEPEGYRSDNENNNFYNGDENSYSNNEKQNLGENSYYNNEQQSFGETKLLGSSYTNPSNNRNNYNYNNNNNNFGDSNSYYNGQQQGMSDTRFNNKNYKNNYNYNNGGNSNGVQKQGMSDTRYLENGKYYYDIGMEQNLNRGPYGENVYRGYNGHKVNSYENNNYNEVYQNQKQFQNFQDEEDLP